MQAPINRSGSVTKPASSPGPRPGSLESRRNGCFAIATLHNLEILLDEAFRIPGTRIRFGIDGIIGLSLASATCWPGCSRSSFLWPPGFAAYPTSPSRAWQQISASVCLVGSIPLFGDIFDVFWKANRRNYRLLCLHLEEPRRRTARQGLGVPAAVAGILGSSSPSRSFWWCGCSSGSAAVNPRPARPFSACRKSNPIRVTIEAARRA